MEKLRLGRIINVVGLKGELRVYTYTDYKEKFEEIDYVLLNNKKYWIEGVRYLKNMAILKLAGIDNRTQAESYKDQDLYIFRKDAPPLPKGTYYVKDLIGLLVVDQNGKEIGRLNDVILNNAQDLYEVQPIGGGKTFCVPAVDEFILEINLEEGIIRVHLIEGLMEL